MDQKTRKKLNIVIGQLEGIGRMMERDEECQSVLNQLKAARSGLSALMLDYAGSKMQSCLEKGKGKQAQKILSDLIKYQ
jgi:DNA-binding FrmR family transcriptional regulator